jgi:hypothetical protein
MSKHYPEHPENHLQKSSLRELHSGGRQSAHFESSESWLQLTLAAALIPAQNKSVFHLCSSVAKILSDGIHAHPN